MQQPDQLKDKIILITGASSGIGRAVATILGSNSATCILLARNIKNLEQIYDDIIKANGPTPAVYPFNLITATPEDYAELRRTIDQNFGVLDGLINVAGQVGTLTPIEQYPIEQWYKLFQVNLHSTFMLTQAVLPLLKRANNSKVVFTINKIAHKPSAFWGAYGITNSGLESFSKILTDEFANNPNLNFYNIYPDKVKTSLYTGIYPGADPKELQSPEQAAQEYLEVLTSH